MDRIDAWTDARIVALRDVTADIREFDIAPTVSMPAGAPGAHLPLEVPAQGAALVRTYSLLQGGDGVPYRIAVKRVASSRGGSAGLWRLQPGATLRVASPRNNFRLQRGGASYLLIAGGIGVTPIRGMAQALAAAGAHFDIVYAARSRADLAYAEDLHTASGGRLSTRLSGDGQRIDFAALFAAARPGTEAYVCGPLGLMHAARQAWAEAGLPPERLRFETFGAGGQHRAQAFDVALPRLGLNLHVGAAESLLDALDKAGVAMLWGCRKGECGLCALPVKSAECGIDHRDVFFSDDEKQAGASICTCVSRALGGTLVLDTWDRG